MGELEDYKYCDSRDHHFLEEKGKIELEAILKEIDDERTLKENPKVLEVGCGSAMFMKLLRKMWISTGHKMPLRLQGIDIKPFVVDLAIKRGEAASLGDALNFVYKTNDYNIIYGLYILQEVEPIKLIKESLRVAKKVIFIYETGIKIKRTLRQVPNEIHKIYKLYDFITDGGEEKSVYMVVINRQTKSKEVDKSGIGIDGNDSSSKR